jgi:hypothetical protein
MTIVYMLTVCKRKYEGLSEALLTAYIPFWNWKIPNL